MYILFAFHDPLAKHTLGLGLGRSQMSLTISSGRARRATQSINRARCAYAPTRRDMSTQHKFSVQHFRCANNYVDLLCKSVEKEREKI